jgi:hypothetical protein
MDEHVREGLDPIRLLQYLSKSNRQPKSYDDWLVVGNVPFVKVQMLKAVASNHDTVQSEAANQDTGQGLKEEREAWRWHLVAIAPGEYLRASSHWALVEWHEHRGPRMLLERTPLVALGRERVLEMTDATIKPVSISDGQLPDNQLHLLVSATKDDQPQ